jgi:FMN reductase
MSDIAVIAGSPSPSSRSAQVLEHAARLAAQHRLGITHIAVRELPPAELLAGRPTSPPFAQAHDAVARARGVIVGTPVYKAAYSGLLKAYLDTLPPRALAGKLVLPVATAATPTHLLSLEYALKPVLAALDADAVLRGVFLVDTQLATDATGRVTFAPAAEEQLAQAVALLARLLTAKGA